jgi:alkylation response protein AidB-like acyl-CoA dehydrogenase
MKEAPMNAIASAGGRTGSRAFQAYQRSVDELVPLIEAEATAGERQNYLSDEVVAALRRSGIYAMLLPAALGGVELPFVEAMQIVERLAWADGSAGWCTMVAGVMAASAGAFIPEGGAQTIYGAGGDVTMSGNGVPRGTARKVPGGYLFKGHWAYGSGIQHAEWVHSGCFVMEGDTPRMNADGTPDIVLIHHARDTVTLLGNWEVLGLRGTGSFDYTLKDGEIFIADELCYPFDGAVQQRGSIQYSVGLAGLTSWGHTGWALGIGRRALDEINEHANARRDVFGLLADSATFRKSYAEAEAKYRAARAFVYEAWNDVTASFARGEPASLRQIALIRLAFRHIHDVVSEVTTFAHKAARGASLHDSRLQRVYRDAHTGTQHLLLADEVQTECARVLLGRTSATATWTMFGVIEPAATPN